jgi:rubrerythrin
MVDDTEIQIVMGEQRREGEMRFLRSAKHCGEEMLQEYREEPTGFHFSYRVLVCSVCGLTERHSTVESRGQTYEQTYEDWAAEREDRL